MSNAIKHHFTCNEWDFKWLLLDDNSNAYIDVNHLVAYESQVTWLMSC